MRGTITITYGGQSIVLPVPQPDGRSSRQVHADVMEEVEVSVTDESDDGFPDCTCTELETCAACIDATVAFDRAAAEREAETDSDHDDEVERDQAAHEVALAETDNL